LTLTRSSAFVALANLGYISDIIIIIIIKNYDAVLDSVFDTA